MADVLLPLQRDSQRRRLDPHIYEWPRPDAEHELAELPLLDWRSGSAVDVREAVLREFEELAAASGESLLVRRQHEVMAIEPGDGRFLLTLDREGANGARERAHDEFDIVILAIGFGIEPRQAIAGTDTPSYWLDAGVPGPEIEGKARPTFFVSGSGDGGLIDLIAAGSRGFSHETVIRSIAQRPGVRALSARLLAID